jgi:hypothetical protein
MQCVDVVLAPGHTDPHSRLPLVNVRMLVTAASFMVHTSALQSMGG